MLSFDRVDVHIEGVRVLRDLTFTVEGGSTVALVGRNGAGKTTTLRAVMGLVPLSGGNLGFDGEVLSGIPAHDRPGLGIGYAPEDRRLFAAFNVEDNVTLPARIAGLSGAALRERLDGVYDVLPELAAMRQRPAGSVSGGQGKMVALGRALMIGTRLILLDEPFQGLAPALAHRYADTLARLRDRRPELALVVTESNPALLQDLAERVLVIERGEVAAADGTAMTEV